MFFPKKLYWQPKSCQNALLCALLTIPLLAAGAFAQVTTSGRLTGTVTDTQGAVMSNAQINF
jgi:hypothetical protein